MVKCRRLTLEEAEKHFGNSYRMISKLTPEMKESIRKRREREIKEAVENGTF